VTFVAVGPASSPAAVDVRQMLIPPSKAMAAPVMNRLSSEARNSTVSAMPDCRRSRC
jgi:hypothetical protein